MKAQPSKSLTQKLAWVITLLVVIASLAPNTTYSQHQKNEEITQKLEPFIAEAFAVDLSPGMAVAVIQGRDVVYAQGFGYADLATQRRVTPETMFYIASTTKSFTAFAAALLHARGKLDLDAPVSRYLPDLKLQAPLSADSISMRALLTHTHGIDNNGPVVFRTAFSGVYTNAQLIELLRAHGPAENGRDFRYGNIGYNVAGLAMDAALGRSWKDVLQQEIFKPLGMENTNGYISKVDKHRLAMPYAAEEKGYRPLPYAKSDANMHAAGGHVSTVFDLAEWLMCISTPDASTANKSFPKKS
jgi:CubicO group peptidase (beta-lactamase class C family)